MIEFPLREIDVTINGFLYGHEIATFCESIGICLNLKKASG